MEERRVEVVPTYGVSHISWGSILGGIVIVLIVQLMLMLLGLAIGLGTIDPATEDNPLGGLGIGSAVWWVLSSVIALFCGGWVSSRLAGLQRPFDGVVHGIITWGLSTLVMIYLLTSLVGVILGGAFGVIRNVAGGAWQALSTAAPEAAQAVTGEQDVMAELRDIYSRLTEAEREDIGRIAQKVVKGERLTMSDRRTAVDLLTKYTDMTEMEAEERVDRWIEQYREVRPKVEEQLAQAGEQVKEIAGDVSSALSTAALWSFIMLLLGAIAAGAGGAVGRVKGPVHI